MASLQICHCNYFEQQATYANKKPPYRYFCGNSCLHIRIPNFRQMTWLAQLKRYFTIIIITIEFITWPPLYHTLLTATQRWPSDKADHSCEIAF